VLEQVGLISDSVSMPSACWVEMRIFSISTGLPS